MRNVGIALLLSAGALPAASVVILAAGNLGPPARYGLAKLSESLTAKGLTVERSAPGRETRAEFVVLAGLATDARVAAAIRGADLELPVGAEASASARTKFADKPAVALCGSDARGLMYAALDAADRVGWAAAADPFARVRNSSEKPYLAERGISIYTMQRAYFESRLYDENYWKRYFDLLARSRINTFTLIFGYENGGFLAPVYPYFFDVPGFPGVRMVGLSRAQQERNTAALHALMRIAHERGVGVIPAIWDHIYRGGVQGGGIEGASDTVGKDVPGLVSGVTADNLAAYTKAALRRFTEVFPEIDGVEFRMHSESGLKPEEMPAFWHEVFGIIAKARPGLRITLRAKELPDSIIDDALHQGLHARVETKYWMEQMGLPFHPTHINRQNQKDRRHGYADLLTYPQRYRVLWRLWTGGTARLLLWGDPEYVRRFAASARLYDGNAVDANEILATKMLGEPHDKTPWPILTAKYRYTEYEFERYWHFYQLWGRLTYNPQTPAGVWEQEFGHRFGASGTSLMRGLHTASAVLPRIVAASYRYQLFPTTRGWAEMMRQGDLPQFADAEGSDIEQFENPRAEAKRLLSGTDTSLRRPQETSSWFSTVADQVLERVAEAEKAGASGKEAASTIADLKILAWLARYHAARLQGAVDYNLYREGGGAPALDRAIEHERTAVAAWAGIVKAAGDIYSPELAFGVHRVGFPRHWKEELENLQRGLAKLNEERNSAKDAAAKPGERVESSAMEVPRVTLQPPGTAKVGVDLQVHAQAETGTRLRLRYRHLTQFEDYQAAEMAPDSTGMYTARIPGSFIVPKWDLIYFVEAIGAGHRGRNYPDLEESAPYVVVPVER
jgi:hypothetical protein